MIYPTKRFARLAAGAAFAALALVAFAPAFWGAGLGLVAVLAALIVLDVVLAAPASAADVSLEAPSAMMVGRGEVVRAHAALPEKSVPVNVALGGSDILSIARTADPFGFRVTPKRRGVGRIEQLWARWRGPLGLAFVQRTQNLDHEIAVSADTRLIEEEAISVLTREFLAGQRAQIDQGDGSEFDSLQEFQTGMDLRALDWKQSARHRTLLTRQFRTERNHSIVFAVDCGRLMSAPVEGGLSRLDHSLNAALYMAFVSLRLGDRVALFAFDERPRIESGFVSGPRAFPLMRRLATRVDYAAEETNYTLALTSLAQRLDRRSLVVVFTDFADATSAEIMLADLGPIMKRHLIVFVAFRDDELERLTSHEPRSADDVTRAVIAETLLRDRDIVLARLQRMGAHVVDAPADRIGPALINRYLKVKRRNLL